MVGSRQPRAAQPMKPRVKKRMSYDNAFKLQVVQAALQRPVDNRIKPTCACYPGIEPCQVRPPRRAATADALARIPAQHSLCPARSPSPAPAPSPSR